MMSDRSNSTRTETAMGRFSDTAPSIDELARLTLEGVMPSVASVVRKDPVRLRSSNLLAMMTKRAGPKVQPKKVVAQRARRIAAPVSTWARLSGTPAGLAR